MNCVLVPYFEENSIQLKSVQCGLDHVSVLSWDGHVYGFGDGAEGQMGTGGKFSQNPTPVRAAVKASAQEKKMEDDREDTEEKDVMKVAQIWCGHKHVCARSAKDEYYMWGSNSRSQISAWCECPEKCSQMLTAYTDPHLIEFREQEFTASRVVDVVLTGDATLFVVTP